MLSVLCCVQSQTLYPSLQIRIIRQLSLNEVDNKKMVDAIMSKEATFRQLLTTMFDNLLKYNHEDIILIVRDFLTAFKNDPRAGPFSKWFKRRTPSKRFPKQMIAQVCHITFKFSKLSKILVGKISYSSGYVDR